MSKFDKDLLESMYKLSNETNDKIKAAKIRTKADTLYREIKQSMLNRKYTN